MDTSSSSTLREAAEQAETALATMLDAELLLTIDTERAEGRAFGTVAELARHELARRTGRAS